MMRHGASVMALLLLAGCASVTPPPSLPDDLQAARLDAWPASTAAQVAPAGVPLDAAARQWWRAFGDDTLNTLMTQAQRNNLDLRAASARVLEAQALRRGARAQWWPQFDAGVDVERARTLQTDTVDTVAQAGVAARWEVDISGRLRHAARAADAGLQALEAERDALQLALLADVARYYIEYRLYQAQQLLAQKNANAQRATVRITQARLREGMASRLDVERAQALLFNTEASVPQAREQGEAARARLVLLLASAEESLAQLLPRTALALDTEATLPVIPAADAAAVLLTPAQVLVQRADVRAAERRLVAASASLRESGALRYPTLNLAGFIGVASSDVGDLFSGDDTRVWSASGGLLAPLFDFGRIRAQIDAADARQLQAYLAYEQSVRTALSDVQTATVFYTQGVLRQRALASAVDAARKAAELAHRNYREGTLSLLDVLVAERSLYDSELAWSQASADVSLRLVTLWQAMGVMPVEQR